MGLNNIVPRVTTYDLSAKSTFPRRILTPSIRRRGETRLRAMRAAILRQGLARTLLHRGKVGHRGMGYHWATAVVVRVLVPPKGRTPGRVSTRHLNVRPRVIDGTHGRQARRPEWVGSGWVEGRI